MSTAGSPIPATEGAYKRLGTLPAGLRERGEFPSFTDRTRTVSWQQGWANCLEGGHDDAA
jgi:hypothetical protein